QRGSASCLSLGAWRVDQAVAEQVLSALQPAGVQAALDAAEQLRDEQRQQREALALALEGARYEAERARRREGAGEPGERLGGAGRGATWGGGPGRGGGVGGAVGGSPSLSRLDQCRGTGTAVGLGQRPGGGVAPSGGGGRAEETDPACGAA